MISTICRHVDGLPLAIELAAARTPHVPLAVLLARLQEGLDAFGTGLQDAPERQRTMRSAIGWSVDTSIPSSGNSSRCCRVPGWVRLRNG